MSSERSTPRPLQAVIVLSVLYMLARLTGLVQTSIINSILPRGASDAYWAAFAIPDFINYLVAGGALSITFIPIFTQLQQSGREREAWKFFSTVATIMGGVLLLLLLAAEFAARPLVALARSGFLDRPDVFELTVAMTRVLLPAQWFFYIGGLLVGVLNAYKRFAASGWTGAVYNLAAIAVALVLLGIGAGPIAFAWGILFGAVIGNFLLPLLAARKAPPEQRPQYSFSVDLSSPAVRSYFINAIPIMFGVSLPVVDQLVVGWFASFLPEGTITYLAAGNRIMIAAQGIVGQAASVAAFPYLAAHVAAGNWDDFSKFLRDGLRRLIFITLPLSTLMILLSRPIVELVYGYGLFQTPEAMSQTAMACAFYSVGLFAWTAQQLVARGFYAMQDTLTPTIIGSVLTVFFFIPLAWLAARWGAVPGLAFATSIGACAHFIAISLALDNRLRRRPYDSPLRFEKVMGLTLRTIVACLMMAVAGYGTSTLLATQLPVGKLGALLQIAGVGVLSTTAFAFAAHWFAIPEWNWLSTKITARLRR